MTQKIALFWVAGRFSISHERRVVLMSKQLEKLGYDCFFATAGTAAIKGLTGRDDNIISLDGWLSESGEDRFLTINSKPVSEDPEWKQSRRSTIQAALKEIQPDVIITEAWPFALNSLYSRELMIMCAMAYRRNVPVISLVRDIPIYGGAGVAGTSDAENEVIKKFVSAVIVEGDGTFKATDAVPWLKAFRDKIHYSGYFIQNTLDESQVQKCKGGIIVTCGHAFREDEYGFYKGVISSIPFISEGSNIRILVPEDCPEHIFNEFVKDIELFKEQGFKVEIEHNRKDFPDIVAANELLVSRGGNGTFTLAVQLGVKTLIIPRPNSKEQIYRAEYSASNLGIGYVSQDSNPEIIAAEIDRVLCLTPRNIIINTDGAFKAAEIVDKIVGESPRINIPTSVIVTSSRSREIGTLNR